MMHNNECPVMPVVRFFISWMHAQEFSTLVEALFAMGVKCVQGLHIMQIIVYC